MHFACAWQTLLDCVRSLHGNILLMDSYFCVLSQTHWADHWDLAARLGKETK